MQELWQLPGGNQCATNQVLTISVHEGLSTIYFPGARNSSAGDGLQSVSSGRAVAQWAAKNAVVNEIAHAHNISAAQVLWRG